MKKLAIMVIALAMLTGFALADPGMKPVPETQGIVVSTSVFAAGEITSDVDLSWEITNVQPLAGAGSPPPLMGDGSTYYEVTYKEDTVSTGLGAFAYDTTMDIETAAVTTPLSNVKAEKQIFFASAEDGAARIVSTDNVFLDGAGIPASPAVSRVICPFSSSNTAPGSEAFCNNVEMGSTIDMDFANVVTNTDVRFVTKAADFPVEVNHVISVTQLVPGVDSTGTASAFMNGVIREGRNSEYGEDAPNGFEEIKFDESTSFTGSMSEFIKAMHYESGPAR